MAVWGWMAFLLDRRAPARLLSFLLSSRTSFHGVWPDAPSPLRTNRYELAGSLRRRRETFVLEAGRFVPPCGPSSGSFERGSLFRRPMVRRRADEVTRVRGAVLPALQRTLRGSLSISCGYPLLPLSLHRQFCFIRAIARSSTDAPSGIVTANSRIPPRLIFHRAAAQVGFLATIASRYAWASSTRR